MYKFKSNNIRIFTLCFLVHLTLMGVSAQNLARPVPSGSLNQIDEIVKNGISAKAFPGCQVLVWKKAVPIYDKCFGTFTYEGTQKVTPNTIYDLASLTKTTGTLLAIMKLYDVGKLKLTDRASDYLAFLKNTDKENITITDLLFHESGLPASLSCFNLIMTNKSDNCVQIGNSLMCKSEWVAKNASPNYNIQIYDGFYLSNNFHIAAMQKIAHAKLKNKAYLYSCVNFILLKEIAESISGKSMDEYIDNEFFKPLKIGNIAYLPLRNYNRSNIAPTLKRDFLRDGLLQGYVQDPDAAILGGISGNAGLFATSRAVASVYQMLLNGGELNGVRCLSQKTCKLFTTTTSASGRRGLGFDKPVVSNPKHSPCSELAPAEVYGHTGYTGTCCWVDPKNELIYVFLSNRTYPNDGINKLSKMGIRTKIQTQIYKSIGY